MQPHNHDTRHIKYSIAHLSYNGSAAFSSMSIASRAARPLLEANSRAVWPDCHNHSIHWCVGWISAVNKEEQQGNKAGGDTGWTFTAAAQAKEQTRSFSRSHNTEPTKAASDLVPACYVSSACNQVRECFQVPRSAVCDYHMQWRHLLLQPSSAEHHIQPSSAEHHTEIEI